MINFITYTSLCLLAGVCMLLYCTLVVFACLFVCLFVCLLYFVGGLHVGVLIACALAFVSPFVFVHYRYACSHEER